MAEDKKPLYIGDFNENFEENTVAQQYVNQHGFIVFGQFDEEHGRGLDSSTTGTDRAPYDHCHGQGEVTHNMELHGNQNSAVPTITHNNISKSSFSFATDTRKSTRRPHHSGPSSSSLLPPPYRSYHTMADSPELVNPLIPVIDPINAPQQHYTRQREPNVVANRANEEERGGLNHVNHENGARKMVTVIVPLCFCLIVSALSISLGWAAFAKFLDVVFDFPILMQSTAIGVSFLILLCVALPAFLRARNHSHLGEIPQSCCSAKFVFYVTIVIAGSITFVGTFATGLLQVFYTTNYEENTALQDNSAFGGSTASIDLLASILCIVLLVVTFTVCFKDRSRQCRNECIKVFILLNLLLISSLVACMMTYHGFEALVETDVNQDIYARLTDDGKAASMFTWATVISAASAVLLLLGCCVCGPITCCAEFNVCEISRQNAIKLFSSITILWSLIALGNLAAGILMMVACGRLANESFDPDSRVNRGSLVTMAFTVGATNFAATTVATVALCIGCRGLFARGVVQQQAQEVEQNNDN